MEYKKSAAIFSCVTELVCIHEARMSKFNALGK